MKQTIGNLFSKGGTALGRGLLLALAVALFSGATAFADDDFRVAVLHAPPTGEKGEMPHHNEYDSTLKVLGWTNRKFTRTAENLDRLAGDLEKGELFKYDMLITTPLYFYGDVDMRAYAPAFKKFVEQGGALVLMDCLYPEGFDWLTSIDPTLAFGRDGRCFGKGAALENEPRHPIQFFPNDRKEFKTWGHLNRPADSSWEVVIRCTENHPLVMMKRMGKGFIYVTALRQPTPPAFRNIRANLELQRMGLSAVECSIVEIKRFNRNFGPDLPVFPMPSIKTGEAKIVLELTNQTDRVKSIRADFKIDPEGEPVKAARPGESNPKVSRKVVLAPGKCGAVVLPYANPLRGKVHARFTLTEGKETAVVFDIKKTLPELVNPKPPRYRALAVDADLERRKAIVVGVNVVPSRENVAFCSVKTRITDPTGKTCFGEDLRKVRRPLEYFRVKLSKPLPPGDYLVESSITSGGRVQDKQTVPFSVAKESELRCYVDDDVNIVVDGKPFFPIGIYHISAKDLLDFGQSIGFNMVQVFSWSPDLITACRQTGTKVLYEFMHKTPENVGQHISNTVGWGEHTFVLKNEDHVIMWYSADEPAESWTLWTEAVSEAFHRADRTRPTYFVNCTSHILPMQVNCADIIAVDNYPYGNEKSEITSIADFIDNAHEACRRTKPVVFIPQSFGHEPEGPFRAMVYLALAHEVNGIIWYPWDDKWFDRNKADVGIKYNPAQQEILKKLVAEIKELAPALMNPVRRQQFKSEDGKIHGLFCQDGKKRYMILVNPHKTENTITLDKLPPLRSRMPMKGAFDGAKEKSYGKLTLAPYATKVYLY